MGLRRLRAAVPEGEVVQLSGGVPVSRMDA
jgi:hypothetical protein